MHLQLAIVLLNSVKCGAQLQAIFHPGRSHRTCCIVLLKTFKQFAAPNRARAHYHYVRDASTFQSGNRVVRACPIYVNLVRGIPLGGEDDPIRFQCQDTSEDRVIATFTKRNVSEVDVQKRAQLETVN